MAWAMARPANRSDSRRAQFVKRLPVDVVGRLRGVPFAIEFPATHSTPARSVVATIGRDSVRFSLGTTAQATVQARQALALVHVERLIGAARTGPRALTHKEAVALSGEVYRRFVGLHEDEPGSRDRWASVKAFNRAVREGRIDHAPVLGVENDDDTKGRWEHSARA